VLIELNMERTHLTSTITDIFLEGRAGEIIPALLALLKEMKGS